jgi:hypothetical protein
MEPIEVSTAWGLSPQIEDISTWLSVPENADRIRGSILDIGFDCRLNGRTVAVQGETVPTGFMERLASLHVTLWLSIYSARHKFGLD